MSAIYIGGRRPPQALPHRRESGLFVPMTELAAAGIVFAERGVEFRKWPARPYVPTGIKQKK